MNPSLHLSAFLRDLDPVSSADNSATSMKLNEYQTRKMLYSASSDRKQSRRPIIFEVVLWLAIGCWLMAAGAVGCWI
jgi:hypothetical protein